ncbi:MAG: RNA 2',3'-cyclic phosphodiesterase [Candidatus Syntrophosphaera sp.]
MKYRTFIALEAPEPVHKSLAERLMFLRPVQGVKWVRDQNLHLTLLFLGDVESTAMPVLEKTLAGHAQGQKAFNLNVKGLELFPAKKPRLVWASLANPDKDLFDFHKDLINSIRREGFEPDIKPLRLHITLGRIRSPLPVSLERDIMQSDVDTGTYAYDKITLYRSVLKPEGPTYHVLEQYKLT